MDKLKTYRGVVEVTGYRNGKMFHYDKSDNTVTIWAKHAAMHMMTGEAFSSHGKMRSFTGHSLTTNPDGSMISGEQFMTDYDSGTPGFNIDSKWSKSTVEYDQLLGDENNGETLNDNLKFPFFPTKMLFGTGFEYKTWDDISTEDQAIYESYGYAGDKFGAVTNDYTNMWNGSTLDGAKTMNDNVNRTLTNTISTEEYGINGAIKVGGYEDSSADSDKLINTSDAYYLNYQYRGIGKPAFIYCKRDERYFSSSSEIALNRDDDKIENKITFSITMPEQTGSPKDFYPYNGYTLKEAGLFSDARLLFNNTIPTSGLVETEYKRMPYGILIAKRNIAPITKSHEVSINVKWTIYL